MIDRNISVHLQDFPNLSYLPDETNLVADMDLVRNICSTALSIRDNKNLRVRLPLNQLIVIGKNAERILPFKDIIADEINVKSIQIKEEISELAELKLQINFKKIGAKFGSKIKAIMGAVKQGNWKKISENEIEITAGDEKINLIDDDFEIKLATKNNDEKKFAIAALSTNDYLVQLDIEITEELANEGIARDAVRAVQQNRKDANLDISDRIELKIFSENKRIIEVIKSFDSYIKDQVLAEKITCVTNAEEGFFENNLEEGKLFVGVSKE